MPDRHEFHEPDGLGAAWCAQVRCTPVTLDNEVIDETAVGSMEIGSEDDTFLRKIIPTSF